MGDKYGLLWSEFVMVEVYLTSLIPDVVGKKISRYVKFIIRWYLITEDLITVKNEIIELNEKWRPTYSTSNLIFNVEI